MSNMTLRDSRAARTLGGDTDFTGAYTCNSCGHYNIANVLVADLDDYASIDSALDQAEPILAWLPSEARGKSFPDVPKEIGDAASEVHACLSIQAHRAAVALARAVVEATAKEKGFDKGSLKEKIDKLASAGHLRASTKDAAHEVRLDGNAIAHGDLAIDPPDADEATEIVALMDEVLQEVYQGPARVETVRNNRKNREGKAT